MAREYYYNPEEITPEFLLELYSKYQACCDVPLTSELFNSFFKSNISFNDHDEIFELGQVGIEMLSDILDEISITGTVEEIIVIPGAFRQVMLDDTLIDLPKIYLRILE